MSTISLQSFIVLKISILLLTVYKPVVTQDAGGSVALYPHGQEVGDLAITDLDEGYSPAIHLQPNFPFFQKSESQLFVDMNGRITFKESGGFTTDIEGFPMVAPFYADTNTEIGGYVYLRKITRANDSASLERATREIREASSLYRDFLATWGFIATWEEVAFYGALREGRTRRNSFQAVLVRNEAANESFAIFNYEKLQWTAGEYNGGNALTGLGGETPAFARIDSGKDGLLYELPGSHTDESLKFVETSNCGTPGRWIYPLSTAAFLVPKISVNPSIFGLNETLVIANSSVDITCSYNGTVLCDDFGDMKEISSSLWTGNIKKDESLFCSCIGGTPEKVNITTAYGPEGVKLEAELNKTFNLCNEDVVVHCSAEDFYPGVKMQLIVDEEIILEQEKGNNFTFTFRPRAGGRLSVKCRAVNSAFSHISQSSDDVVIHVLAPPKGKVQLTMAAKHSYTYYNSSKTRFFRVAEGERVDLSCDVEGSYQGAIETDIKCAGLPVVNNSFIFYRNMTAKRCTCQATHVSGCYQELASVPVNVIHAPDTPRLYLVNDGAESSYILCPRKNRYARTYAQCVSEESDEIPVLDMSVSPHPDKDKRSEWLNTTSRRFLYTFWPESGGFHNITCSARIRQYRFRHLRSVSELQVYVAEASSHHPVLSINGKEFSGDANTMTVVEGEVYHLTCRVDGGFPDTTNTSVTCAGVTLTNDTFVFSRAMSHDQCTCSGEHVSGCYSLETSVRLEVLLACATSSHLQELKEGLEGSKDDQLSAQLMQMKAEIADMKRQMKEDMETVVKLLQEIKSTSIKAAGKPQGTRSGPKNKIWGKRLGLGSKYADDRCRQVKAAVSPAPRVWDVFRFLDSSRRDDVTSWYFDLDTGKCRKVYHSRTGRGRGFPSLEECQAACV